MKNSVFKKGFMRPIRQKTIIMTKSIKLEWGNIAFMLVKKERIISICAKGYENKNYISF